MRSLVNEGVETLFGYPGGAIMPVYDALYDYRDRLNHILVRHEQGAVHAAQGFARVSGKVGCAIVTSGPGATNTVTGIADAMIDSTPMVVICGQVGTSLLGTDAFQEVDVVGVTSPISKWSYQIRRAEDVAWAVSRAFYIAKSGRPGPVVLDFAKNAQTAMVDYEPAKVDFIFRWLFGFTSPQLISFPITALGAVGAAIGLVPRFIAEGIIDNNAVAVFTAMGMCWSGYLSTHTAMLDSLGYRKLIGKAIGAHTIGGLVAGIAAHWLFVLLALIFA